MSDSYDVFHEQLRTVENILRNGPYNQILPFIKPFIVDRDMSEKNNIIPMEFPYGTVSETTDLFDVYYVLDWTEKYPSIDSYDFVTPFLLKKAGVDKKDLMEIGLFNLKRNRVLYKVAEYQSERGPEFKVFRYYITYTENCVLPSCTPSLILLDELWYKLYLEIGTSYYVLPFYREEIFVVPEKDFDDIVKVCIVKDLPHTYKVPFSSKTFYFNEKKRKLVLA